MSWLYSRALAEAYSAAKSSDGGQSVPSKSTNTPAMYLSHGKTTEPSRLSRFGTTCEHLTDDRGEELLTLFLEDSHVRTSALPAQDAASMGEDRVSGRKWRALCVKYDRDTSSWKTHRCLFPGDSIESLQTLPKWGLMRSGELWELTTPALPTVENGYGYWPTPTVCGNYNRPKDGTNSGTGLATAVKMWPTPVASAANTIKTKRDRPQGKRLDEAVGGHLNPEWVEWLMGCPIGHTGLEPLETGRYQEWLRWHGEF